MNVFFTLLCSENKNITQMKLLSASFLTSALISILIIVPFSSIAQKQNTDNRYMHNEVIDDPYLPMLPKDYQTSPAYRYRSNNIFTTQVNVNAEGENILFDAANEPSIAFDPTNPDRMVIGWRQFDNVASNFRQAGYGYSTDAGQTWTFPYSIDAGVFRSDPVLEYDDNGNFYYNSLTINASNDYVCDVYKINDGGVEWDNGTYAFGGDKQWMQIDRTGGMGNGNIYAFWTSYYSICNPDFFTRSIDEGDTYEDCVEIPGNPYWGTVTVGPDGEVYTVGTTTNISCVVTKSTTAKDPDATVTWEEPTYVDLDGDLRIGGNESVNPAGLLGQAWIDIDRSDGPGRGYVYVLASVDRNNGDPVDVMFARSIDGGQSWEEPVRVNDDVSYDNWQWFGTMSVAPNGRIDVIWLDTRDAVGNPYFSALYYSYSVDQGVTWSENEKLSESFNPHLGWPNQNKMGDYFDMVSDDNGAHLAWANTINGEQDVYYSFINPWFVGLDDNIENDKLFSFIVYPNPVGSKTTFRYELQKSNLVNITIYDIYGNTVKVVTDELYNAGIHNIVFNASELTRGIYFCKLTSGAKSETIKLTLIN